MTGRPKSQVWEFCHPKDPDAPKPKFYVTTIMVCNYCPKEMMKKAERWAIHFRKCPGDVPIEARRLWEEFQTNKGMPRGERKSNNNFVAPLVNTLSAPETVTINGEEVVVQRGLSCS